MRAWVSGHVDIEVWMLEPSSQTLRQVAELHRRPAHVETTKAAWRRLMSPARLHFDVWEGGRRWEAA